MRTATTERPLNGGIQRIYRFNNGRGASVVKHKFSHGNEKGLWELAVIKFEENKNNFDFNLDYSTPITSDVLGRLTENEIDGLLAKIEALP